MLNSGNEPKDLLKRKELAFFGAKNELVFECKRTQKTGRETTFCAESKSNSRVQRRRRLGEREGGYTSFEFDVARHWKSAEGSWAGGPPGGMKIVVTPAQAGVHVSTQEGGFPLSRERPAGGDFREKAELGSGAGDLGCATQKLA
jgi:hypothetical protein